MDCFHSADGLRKEMKMNPFWPSAGDYSLAMLNPSACLRDEGLREGAVSINPATGMPVSCSGTFSIVFPLTVHRRGQPASRYALRCFTRPPVHQDVRYPILGQALSPSASPAWVRFEFQPQGVFVNGGLYPLLVMDWVEGRPLDRLVHDWIRSKIPLSPLAEQFRHALEELWGGGMAHGDLQHGNILYDDNGQLRLIDYDAMYHPDLKPLPPAEAGHLNYQHPERIRTGYYGANLDAFSALAIYLSLRAVDADPRIWNEFHAEDRLIFSEEDYRYPGWTVLWKRLKLNPDMEVRRLADELARFCADPVPSLPLLNALLPGPKVQSPKVHPASPMERLAPRVAGSQGTNDRHRSLTGDIVPPLRVLHENRRGIQHAPPLSPLFPQQAQMVPVGRDTGIDESDSGDSENDESEITAQETTGPAERSPVKIVSVTRHGVDQGY